jgi:peptide/nickel transport system substrate-binding protein
LFIVPIAAVALVLSACSGGGADNGGQNVQVREEGKNDINPLSADKVKDGGTFDVALSGVIEQYNFLHVQGVAVDLDDVLKAVMPRVMNPQADGTTVDDENYVTSKLASTDPQVIEFTINPKAHWSDGTAITWKDFEANWNAQNGKNTAFEAASTAGWEDITSVEKGADDRQVKLTFGKKFAEWRGLTDYLYPASQIDTPEKFNKGMVGKLPVTGGPFKIKTIDDTAKTVTLERDDTWWGDKPKLESIVYHVISADASGQAFQSGTLDAVNIGPSVATFQTVSTLPDSIVRKALARNWRVVNFGARKGSPLEDPKVRTAVFRGLDRTTIAKAAVGTIVPDVRPLGNHIFVEGQKGYVDNGAEYAYNKEQAAKELDAAGWKLDSATNVRAKDGKSFELQWIIPAGVKTSADEAQLAQKQLGEIGVKINIQTVDLDAWQNDYLTVGNFDLLNMSWFGTAFPVSSSTSIYTYFPDKSQQNYGRVPDTEGINDLFAKAAVELDDAKRTELGNQIDKAIWKEGFSMPLYQRPDAIGVKKNVANYGAFGFAKPDWTKVGFTS